MLIFIAISLCACIKQVSNVAYDELITNLKNMGYTIEAEDVEESILYVGEDSEIIHVLEEIIGPQFSGQREQTPQIKEL
mgnify:CR=1 FL=1